jgi:hypothetical protein
MDDSKARLRATAIGFSAVLMWATLALFTALSGKVPPFQLLAMCFSVAHIRTAEKPIAVARKRALLSSMIRLPGAP